MQLVNSHRDALLKPLQTVSGIVERRQTLPILANVLMQRETHRLHLTCNDQEIQISTFVDLDEPAEPITTTVGARKLLDILKALPDSGQVKFELESRKLTVRSSKSRFTLQTLDAADYPAFKSAEEWLVTFHVPQKALLSLFAQVHFAMAQQDIRYYLNAVQLSVRGAMLRAVATDGHRLAYATLSTPGLDANHDVILPRKTVLELQRLLSDSDEPVEVSLARNQIRLRFGAVEVLSKLVEGTYPDCERVIPRGYQKQFVVERDLLQRSLQRAAILTSDKFRGVRLSMTDGTLRIAVNNTEQEEAQEELDIDWTHESLDIGFNVAYLLDVLSNLKSSEVQFSFGDAASSVLVTLPDQDSFKYVVMPLRL